MKHMTEEELIAYREGMSAERAAVAEHLHGCDECRAELARIEAVLAALDSMSVPDPGDDYGRRLWQQIAPHLPEKRVRWWQTWFEPKNLVALGAVAALIVAAFLIGRHSRQPGTPDLAASKEQVRERVLVVAVGEHLGRSEMMLVELSNAEPANPAQKKVNIASEQRRAEDLLDENRLYRQTALQQGDTAMASVLDDLERVLLDVAHSPDQVTPAQLEKIRQKIDAGGILFKVRVVGKELQERQDAPKPAQENSKTQERNKV
ncbi:MAG TPA: hypothetical protein VE263_09540 [Candidatus Angelobacter sp.]|nr:hypothetical protein [Candidatus Angelobacter sp.]